MGLLRQVNGTRSCILEPEHLIGRTSHCSLQLRQTYISGQHALIRWNGTIWELLDRGSRNGTFLNDVAVTAGQTQRLSAGDALAFGHPHERWLLQDAEAPRPMALGADAELWSLSEDGVIGVPSSATPENQIFRDRDALWKLERPGNATIAIRHGDRFEAAGSWWRFCCPEPVGATATSEESAPSSQGTLHFAVSTDEEFVTITVESEARRIDVGSRAHNYLLLTLARLRLEDHANGIAEGSCGWTDKEDLAKKIAMPPEQIDGEIFRIRQHFGRHGVHQAATIVERRPRIRQLRIGWRQITIATL